MTLTSKTVFGWSEHWAQAPGAGAALRDCLLQAAKAMAELEKDAALGRLVRAKMTSGNGVPVERCTIWDREVAAVDKEFSG